MQAPRSMKPGDVIIGPVDKTGYRLRVVCKENTFECASMTIESHAKAAGALKKTGGKAKYADEFDDGDEFVDPMSWNHPKFCRYIQDHPEYNILLPDIPPRVTPKMLNDKMVAKYWIESWSNVQRRPLAAACIASVVSQHKS